MCHIQDPYPHLQGEGAKFAENSTSFHMNNVKQLVAFMIFFFLNNIFLRVVLFKIFKKHKVVIIVFEMWLWRRFLCN
jgi:hypothetical protein